MSARHSRPCGEQARRKGCCGRAQPRHGGPPIVRDTLSKLTKGPWALAGAALLGFLENTIILVALEPLFLPMMASRGRQAWRIAAALVVGNLVAGFAMYALGWWAAEPIIEPFFSWMGMSESFDSFQARMEEDGFVSLFLIGITPVPFQVGAAAAGAAGYSFLFFLIAIGISRAIRYFAEALLIMAFGERAERFIEKHELEIFIGGLLIFAGLVLFWVFG